jgi:hypothetical protein
MLLPNQRMIITRTAPVSQSTTNITKQGKFKSRRWLHLTKSKLLTVKLKRGSLLSIDFTVRLQKESKGSKNWEKKNLRRNYSRLEILLWIIMKILRTIHPCTSEWLQYLARKRKNCKKPKSLWHSTSKTKWRVWEFSLSKKSWSNRSWKLNI